MEYDTLEKLPLVDNNGLAGLQELSNHTPSNNNEDADHVFNQCNDNISISPHSSKSSNEKEDEIIEQFDLGVYITFIRHEDGTKAFKRIRFR